jgi:hypothetical protein
MMGFIWFWLVAVMIVGYVVLDGFDLGVGVLHLFLVRTEAERRATLRSIGPVWDGNEVWLLAGGGTLYFAFPLLYASAFSGFYLPLMIVLWLLVLRGVSLELRNHIDVGVWRACSTASSASPAPCSPSSSARRWPTCCAACRCRPTATSSCPSGPTGNPALAPAFSTGTRSSAASSPSVRAHAARRSCGSPSRPQATWSSAPATHRFAALARLVGPRSPSSASSPPSPCAPPASTTTSTTPFTFVIPAASSHRSPPSGSSIARPAAQGISRLLPLSLLHAGRRLLGRLSHAAARHHRRGPRHHPQSHLRPAHPRRRPGWWASAWRWLSLRRLRLHRFKGNGSQFFGW